MDKNNVFIVKGKIGKSVLMTDLIDRYHRDNELSLAICYDDININSINNIYIIDPNSFSIEQLINDFIPEREKNLNFYNGKIFIYTNKAENKIKDLIKEMKTHDFGNYINKSGDETNKRTIFIFCT